MISWDTTSSFHPVHSALAANPRNVGGKSLRIWQEQEMGQSMRQPEMGRLMRQQAMRSWCSSLLSRYVVF